MYYKLKLNNGYGKFVQHNNSVELRTKPFTAEEMTKKRARLVNMYGPFFAYEMERKEPPKFACFLWGLYITSYARIYLFNVLEAVHKAGHNLLYCDTDSVFYEKKNERIPYKLGSNLGEWDLEEYTQGEIFTLKGYKLENIIETETEIIVEEKIASKGVPNKFASAFFAGEAIQIEKPNKLRSSLNQGKTPNLWEKNTKQKRSEYDKRIIQDDKKSTKPLIFSE